MGRRGWHVWSATRFREALFVKREAFGDGIGSSTLALHEIRFTRDGDRSMIRLARARLRAARGPLQ